MDYLMDQIPDHIIRRIMYYVDSKTLLLARYALPRLELYHSDKLLIGETYLDQPRLLNNLLHKFNVKRVALQYDATSYTGGAIELILRDLPLSILPYYVLTELDLTGQCQPASLVIKLFTISSDHYDRSKFVALKRLVLYIASDDELTDQTNDKIISPPRLESAELYFIDKFLLKPYIIGHCFQFVANVSHLKFRDMFKREKNCWNDINYYPLCDFKHIKIYDVPFNKYWLNILCKVFPHVMGDNFKKLKFEINCNVITNDMFWDEYFVRYYRNDRIYFYANHCIFENIATLNQYEFIVLGGCSEIKYMHPHQINDMRFAELFIRPNFVVHPFYQHQNLELHNILMNYGKQIKELTLSILLENLQGNPSDFIYENISNIQMISEHLMHYLIGTCNIKPINLSCSEIIIFGCGICTENYARYKDANIKLSSVNELHIEPLVFIRCKNTLKVSKIEWVEYNMANIFSNGLMIVMNILPNIKHLYLNSNIKIDWSLFKKVLSKSRHLLRLYMLSNQLPSPEFIDGLLYLTKYTHIHTLILNLANLNEFDKILAIICKSVLLKFVFIRINREQIRENFSLSLLTEAEFRLKWLIVYVNSQKTFYDAHKLFSSEKINYQIKHAPNFRHCVRIYPQLYEVFWKPMLNRFVY